MAMRPQVVYPFRVTLGGVRNLADWHGHDLLCDPVTAFQGVCNDDQAAYDAVGLFTSTYTTALGLPPDHFARLQGTQWCECERAMGEAVVSFFPSPESQPRGHRSRREAETPDGDPWRSVHEAAGFCGVDWRPLTLRELSEMQIGAIRRAYGPMAGIRADLAALAGEKGVEVSRFLPEVLKPQPVRLKPSQAFA